MESGSARPRGDGDVSGQELATDRQYRPDRRPSKLPGSISILFCECTAIHLNHSFRAMEYDATASLYLENSHRASGIILRLVRRIVAGINFLLDSDSRLTAQVQMQQVSADLFADIFTLTVPRHLNLLKQGMRELSEDTGSNLNAELDENLEVLTQFMSSEFTIDEDHVHLQAVYPTDDTNDDEEDEGDDAPVIVELST